ncbi:MAG: hypothetical protein LBI56_02945 [Puniceicoccales bacterium]|jgi:hypothetical protein|nr:hypothetical protein [Puniceicoccales bacterium]
MKKICVIGIVALCMCGAFGKGGLPLHTDLALQYESEHANRGRPEMGKTIGGDARLGFNLNESSILYAGIDLAIELDRPSGNVSGRSEINPYAGLSYDISDSITLDGGFIHHIYPHARTTDAERITNPGGSRVRIIFQAPNDGSFCQGMKSQSMKKHSNEVYFGILSNRILHPSLYCFYDFDKEEIAVEGKISHIFDLSNIAQGISLKVSGKLGCDKAKKMYGLTHSLDDCDIVIIEDITSGVFPLYRLESKWHMYYTVGADLVYSIRENIKISAGVACAGNSASKQDMYNVYGGGNKKNTITFHTSVSCNF